MGVARARPRLDQAGWAQKDKAELLLSKMAGLRRRRSMLITLPKGMKMSYEKKTYISVRAVTVRGREGA